jgi:SAM-dependent methyltransferase
MADALAQELALGGRGRLLDVGCGPGSLALVLAPQFEWVVGIDADADMIAEARREAERLAVRNADWIAMRAEDITPALGAFRVVTFAQSFHWMDKPRVARAAWAVLEPDGAWVHVNATTHRGAETDEPLPSPQPPRDQIRELVHSYLGPVRRAGQGHLPAGTQSGEEEVMAAAGYAGPRSSAAICSSGRRTRSSPRSTPSPRRRHTCSDSGRTSSSRTCDGSCRPRRPAAGSASGRATSSW